MKQLTELRTGNGVSKTLEGSDDSDRADEVVAAMVEDEDDNPTLPLPVSCSPCEAGKTLTDVHISEDDGAEEQAQLQALLLAYLDIIIF